MLALFTISLNQQALAEHASSPVDEADNQSINTGLTISTVGTQGEQNLTELQGKLSGDLEYSRLTRGARSDWSENTLELIKAEESTGYTRGSRSEWSAKTTELTLAESNTGYLRGARH